MPLFLKVANGQQFLAIGFRNMVVSTPNGNGHSKLTLENVLHAPSVSYMLVSLRPLDSLEYCIAISGGHLNIQSCTGNCVVHIVWTVCRLYQVAHEGEGGYAVEIVSVMELHQHMGHIAPKAAWKLVEARLVTGLALDPNSQEALQGMSLCMCNAVACTKGLSQSPGQAVWWWNTHQYWQSNQSCYSWWLPILHHIHWQCDLLHPHIPPPCKEQCTYPLPAVQGLGTHPRPLHCNQSLVIRLWWWVPEQGV